ncbi:hypothetical protein HPC37_03360 [Pasteurellaceae bacterium 20609_3]|uniref:hypothetical protein n=1 Tax=Spirabiliibacterium mucosae TaxID=28156 RepID=UPI001AADFF67|nr:hypothetical protein [Spirabiliibacterium mucosae]MBE2897890.1 hypothetical protein [Spirabiliibacterium mucosae]
MLNSQKKQFLRHSLEQDYVVLTDVVVETVADTKSDMLMLEMSGKRDAIQPQDKQELLALKKAYSNVYKTNPEQAVNIVERIFELNEKYDKLRMQL